MGGLDEGILDAADRLGEADRAGMLRAVAAASAQVRESVALTAEAGVDGYLQGQQPRAVLVAADSPADDVAVTVRALTGGPESTAPVQLHPDAALPPWVGPLDLVLAAAQTGAAERVLALVRAASRRGVPVVGVGPAGSPLQEACGWGRAPYVPLPPGRPPRASFWGLLTPLLIAAARVGLVAAAAAETVTTAAAAAGPEPAAAAAGTATAVTDADLTAAADLLDSIAERCRPTSETFVNPAKALALDIGSSAPALWGTSPLAGAAAYRFAGQLAGLAGQPAVWGTMPAAAYRLGGVLAGASPNRDDLFRDRVDEAAPVRPRLVLFRDVDEASEVRDALERVTRELGAGSVPVTELVAEEAGPVTRLASLVGLADFTAVYVGLARGTDPSGGRAGGIPSEEIV